METPALLRGNFYPSSRKERCASFHPCLATKKCQNYNPHSTLCEYCESMVRPVPNLGGYMAEGEFQPDLQHSLKLIQEAVKKAWSHPDAKAQKTTPRDIADEYDKLKKATNQLAEFSTVSKAKMEEKVEETYLMGNRGGGTEVLGRLK